MNPIHQQTFLITGASGFLGSHIALRLLAGGHRVFMLVRSGKKESAFSRVRRLLDWFGVREDQLSGLEVLTGDLEQQGLGLEGRDAQLLAGGVDEVIHCASDTSFSVRKRERVERTNVRGLEHLLDVVQKNPCRAFHLMSTAYVAGRRCGLCPEDFVQAEGFHNVYEETKFRAEQIAARRCAQAGIILFVHRPSIVYGDAVTGKSLNFKALYYPIRMLHFFQRLYTKDILENDGSRARVMNVHLDPDGILHLPLRIASSDSCGLNLIPVDHFIRAFMAIRQESPEGGVFHIVNPRSTTIRQLAEYTQRFFQLGGICITHPEEFEKHPRNALELLFEDHIRFYGPYMQDARTFEHSKTSAILASQNIICPDFSYEIFETCMSYALAVDWGRFLHREQGRS